MLQVEEARARILAGLLPLDSIEVPVRDARGMVPSDDLFSPHPLPRFDNSAMDGYAVRRADLTSLPAELRVIGEVRAGDPGAVVLTAGTAVRIMTGAPIPSGSDSVVAVEDTTEDDGVVTVTAAPPNHGHIRFAGDDIKAGDLCVAKGAELEAGELALLASLGLSPVIVHRRPVCVVLSTGDELVAPEVDPGPGEIRDSNSIALKALIEEAGGIAKNVGPIADDRAAVRATILEATKDADLIVSSGGVSVGRYDFVKEVVEELGTIDLWRVAMQPGKPVVSGHAQNVPFLGLPGNPVSIHIGFEQFVRPAIRRLRGCSSLLRPTIEARLTTRIEKSPGRLHFVRVRLEFSEEGIRATPTGAQGSHVQSSLVDCHGVARFDLDRSILEAGDPVMVELWRLP